MSDSTKKITHFIDSQIPDYIQEYYPMFVIFITKYFQFLENSSNGAQYSLQNIQLNSDIDTTADDLAVEFTTGPKVPRGDEEWYKHCGIVMKKMLAKTLR